MTPPRPDPPAPGGVISVVGMDGSGLVAVARDRLARAALVVGGARHLESVELPVGVRTVVMGDVAAALDQLGELDGASGVVVLASGDPGFFGIVRVLRERGHDVEVFPALSSVAQAFARAGLSWDDALVVSAHGRELRRAVNVCRAHPKVAVLTGPGAGPAELARELFPQSPRAFVVCEDLGGPGERVTHCRPAEATTRTWRDPNVVLVLDTRRAVGERGWIAGAKPGPAAWALPEAAFEHRGSMVTKAEVRAFVLAKLGPQVGDMVWDIGAGSGSVAIECARFGAAVVAVEKDEASCERIRANVKAHGVKVAVSRGIAPEVLRHLPVPDAVFVGGGGLEVIRACAARALRSMVVTLAALERVGPSLEALTKEGFTAEAVQLQANRLAPLPGGVNRLAATNPVFVVWGVREAESFVRPEEKERRPEAIAQLPEPAEEVVVGVGASRGVTAAEVGELIDRGLAEAAISPESVRALATVDLKSDEPGVLAAARERGWPVLTYPPDVLAKVKVPNPADPVRAETGTGSVAEAAALRAARSYGGAAELVVEKRKSARATMAVARLKSRDGVG